MRRETRFTRQDGDPLEARPGEGAGWPCGYAHCPLKADATRVAYISRDLATTLRRLRRRFQRCRKVGGFPKNGINPINGAGTMNGVNPMDGAGCQPWTCPFYREVRAQIQSAIAQVLEEWDLEGDKGG